MLRKFRIDSPAQKKPWGRRLTLQRLEERLALSTASPITPVTLTDSLSLDLAAEGGFVNVSILPQGFALGGLDFTPSVVASFNDLFLSDGSSDFDGVLGNDLSMIPPPDPFPSDPGGGVIRPFVENSPFGPLPTAEQVLPEANSEASLAEKSSIAEETSPQLIRNLALSRGREVFFNVATLAPPQTFVRPDRIALDTNAARHALDQNKSTPTVRGEHAFDPSATQTPNEATPTEQRATEKVGSVSAFQETPAQEMESQEMGRAVHSTTSHDRFGANQTVSASRPKEATASQSAMVVVSEEEARSQVFADWRNRDLIALPLLVALAAGPRLVRSLRSPPTEAQQLPPKRNRQTVTL